LTVELLTIINECLEICKRWKHTGISSSPCKGGDIVLAVVVVTGTYVVETYLGVVVDVVVHTVVGAAVGAVVGTPLEGEVATEFKLLFG
jgi:hypothetical protein